MKVHKAKDVILEKKGRSFYSNLCGNYFGLVNTKVDKHVSCKRCLKMMNKQGEQ